MHKKFFEYIIFLSIIFIFYIESLMVLNNFNTSIYNGFKILLLVYLITLFLGILISKISFNFRIYKKIEKLNIKNFTLNDLFKSILLSIIILFILFSISYIVIYIFGNCIFIRFTKSYGIINSCLYLSKIFLLSLPLYAFEITYLEYCNFLNTITIPIILIILKSLLLFVLNLILTSIFGINGFLYSKISIDFLLFPYYIIKLRNIIKLTKERSNYE